MSPREAAFLALYASLKEETFILESLDQWRNRSQPIQKDYQLAHEIAYGSSRMALALSCYARQLTSSGNLKLSLKEKALLLTALYQFFYLTKVPLYAIVNESVQIAKKYTHLRFANFLNAVLRKLSSQSLSLPQGETPEDLSIRLSYPIYYVKTLIQDYGKDSALEIMKASNIPSPTMFRVREPSTCLPNETELVSNGPAKVAIVHDSSLVKKLSESKDYYIQNATPANLIAEFCGFLKSPPKTILDLCASPGGKLIAAHDLFPASHLHANDISENRMKKLVENLQKYGIQANLTCMPGETFASDQKHDLIIIDAPCSNTGVLNKRPEARWRISGPAIAELAALQGKIFSRAVELLAPGGAILYMTCSILKEENERFIEQMKSLHALQAIAQKTVLPNAQGWDGGFACLLHAPSKCGP